jgi:hypothetical protein
MPNMARAFTTLLLQLFGLRPGRAYHPERHYMRGPGPKSLGAH